MRKETTAVGIDLGNSYTSLSTLDGDSKPIVIPDSDGLLETPSIVGYRDGRADQVVCGRAAKSLNAVQPQYTIDFMKCGRGKGDIIGTVLADGGTVTTRQAEKELLGWRIRHAKEFLGSDITHIVLSVPANFTTEQRKETQAIAEELGLIVLGIVNEPTVAVLHYCLRRLGKYLVVDLGGGTFDVSIMNVEKNRRFGVLATNGEGELGGRDFTERIVQHFVEQLTVKGAKLDPVNDLRTFVQIQEECERIKCDLSTMDTAFPAIRAGEHYIDEEFTRTKFEELTSDLLERIVQITQDTMEQASLSPEDLKGVVLVGGASRMPCLQRAVQDIFGADLLRKDVDPGQAVVKGCALAIKVKVAEAIADGKGDLVKDLPRYILTSDIVVQDVSGQCYGVRAKDTSTNEFVLAPIVEANTPLPCSTSRMFALEFMEGASVVNTTIVVMEGKANTLADSDDVHILAEFSLKDLPPGPLGERISISFDIDASGLVTVTATDTLSGREIKGTTKCEHVTNNQAVV